MKLRFPTLRRNAIIIYLCPNKRILNMKRVLALAAALLLVCSPFCLADGFRHPVPEIEEFALASPIPYTLFSADLTRAVVATGECGQVPLV